MAEYLDKALLKKRFCGHCDDNGKCAEPCFDVELIENTPSAEVQPVRHGRWVKARGSWCTPGGDPVWECSECGKGTHVYGIEHGTYGSGVADGQWVACPNCGAKMQGDANE